MALNVVVFWGGWVLIFKSLLISIIYVFCRKFPMTEIHFLLIFKLKARQFFYAYVVISMLTDTSWK